MSNKIPSPKSDKYDLQERTILFAEKIILFVKSLDKNDINRTFSNQLLRSGSSIGANYMEADAAESKKDFQHKISLCRKEGKESMYWARILAKANLNKQQECKIIWREAQELVFIFSAILSKSKEIKF